MFFFCFPPLSPRNCCDALRVDAGPTSGCLHQVTQIVSGTMVAVCWSTMEFLPVIQICKFIELTASNMFAITNLAICINLALIVSVCAAWDVCLCFCRNHALFFCRDLTMVLPPRVHSVVLEIARHSWHVEFWVSRVSSKLDRPLRGSGSLRGRSDLYRRRASKQMEQPPLIV